MNILTTARSALRRAQRNSSMAPTRGFTLIELMVVVAILVVLLGLGVPGMTAMIVKTRVKNASFDVYSSILSARSDAIARNRSVTLTPSGGNWAAGWTITDSDGNTLKTQDPLPGISISGPATLVYTNTGHLPAAIPATDRKISLTAPDAAANDGRCINIDLSGRPVVSTGVCS